MRRILFASLILLSFTPRSYSLDLSQVRESSNVVDTRGSIPAEWSELSWIQSNCLSGCRHQIYLLTMKFEAKITWRAPNVHVELMTPDVLYEDAIAIRNLENSCHDEFCTKLAPHNAIEDHRKAFCSEVVAATPAVRGDISIQEIKHRDWVKWHPEGWGSTGAKFRITYTCSGNLTDRFREMYRHIANDLRSIVDDDRSGGVKKGSSSRPLVPRPAARAH